MKRAFIVIAALALGLVGCASMGGGASGITVLETGNHSDITEQEYRDFHNAADLQTYWTKAFGKQDSAPELPQVDWNTRMVLTAFVGSQEHSGYQIRFMKVEDAGDSVHVQVKIVIPCSLHSRLENQQPFTVVSAPATNKPVIYDDPVQQYQKC